MLRTQKTPMVLVLMLVLSHAPVPWLHDHIGGDDPQLTFHLRLFHSKANESEPPKGWHIHLLPFKMLAGGDIPEHSALYFAENASLRFGWPAAGNGNGANGVLPAAISAARRTELLSGSLCSTSLAAKSGLSEVYILFSVLLL